MVAESRPFPVTSARARMVIVPPGCGGSPAGAVDDAEIAFATPTAVIFVVAFDGVVAPCTAEVVVSPATVVVVSPATVVVVSLATVVVVSLAVCLLDPPHAAVAPQTMMTAKATQAGRTVMDWTPLDGQAGP